MAEDLADFLFEVASPERLVILSRLSRGALSHTELARGLKRSASETSRHLQRLAAAGLITKDSNRRYRLTATARVFNAGIGLLEFLVANREFFRSHDVAGLDPRFLSRIGELGKGTFTSGEYGTVSVQENALREAQARVWMISEERLDRFLPTLRECAREGTDVRILCAGGSTERTRRLIDPIEPGFPMQIVGDLGLFLIVVDDRAGICFPQIDGPVDRSTMISVHDPAGLRWAEDLFLECWTRAGPSYNPRVASASALPRIPRAPSKPRD